MTAEDRGRLATDIYIRVSQTGERTDEEATSVYRKRALDHLARQGWKKGEVSATDTDVSGGTKVADRDLERLIVRAENGESEGIIAPDVDRFARDPLEGLRAYRRIVEAGGHLVTLDGIDSDDEDAELFFLMKAGFGHSQLKRTKKSIGRGVLQAIGNGKHIGPTPVGYSRLEGRLVKNEIIAPHIAEAFRLRASGASYQKIADYLLANGVLPKSRRSREDGAVTQSAQWTREGVKSMLLNSTYAGIIRWGDERGVHDQPIISQAEFEAAQAHLKPSPIRDGTTAALGLLTKVVFCAECGKVMTVAASKDPRSGKKRGTYYCRADAAGGRCAAPALAGVIRLDAWVIDQLLDGLENGAPWIERALDAGTRIFAAQEGLTAAQDEMRAFLDAGMAAILGAEEYKAQVERRKADVDAATRSLEQETASAHALTSGGKAVKPKEIVARWDEMNPGERRAIIRTFVRSVQVTRCKPGEGRWTDIADRAVIEWR